jgi:hypothetical protein
MDEKMYFFGACAACGRHGTVFAMLEFIRRLSFEFRDPYTLKSLHVLGSTEAGVLVYSIKKTVIS